MAGVLTGRVAIVTGAGRGIGRGTAVEMQGGRRGHRGLAQPRSHWRTLEEIDGHPGTTIGGRRSDREHHLARGIVGSPRMSACAAACRRCPFSKQGHRS